MKEYLKEVALWWLLNLPILVVAVFCLIEWLSSK